MTEHTAEPSRSSDLLNMTATVVAAYIRKNAVPVNQLSELIGAVHRALASADGQDPAPAPNARPAVPAGQSVTPDYLVCLEDGRKVKMLKRHLRTAFNLSPDEYRTKWRLGPDYPMVAPNYAKLRSSFAKKSGLGRRGRKAAQA